jgi:hypothetical protein
MLEACEMQVLMNDYAEHLGQKKKKCSTFSHDTMTPQLSRACHSGLEYTSSTIYINSPYCGVAKL